MEGAGPLRKRSDGASPGTVPDGVTATRPSPTPWILCLGRTLVDGAGDVANIRALQARYALTPLSSRGRPGAEVPERRDVLVPIEVAADPLGPWKTLNAMLAENPPPAHHGVLLRQFPGIGIGPGLDVEAQPAAVKKGLTRALGAGMRLLPAQFLSGEWATVLRPGNLARDPAPISTTRIHRQRHVEMPGHPQRDVDPYSVSLALNSGTNSLQSAQQQPRTGVM